MLSAKEIINEGNKPTSLPETGGLKYFKFDSNDNEQIESVENALGNYSQCLKEERICRKMNLSVAAWDNETKLALVTTMKGSTLQKFGFQTKDGKFLHPEECLFLVEQGILELFFEDISLSLQESYMMLLQHQPSYEYYQIYANLCRQGYLVTRYKEGIFNENDIQNIPHKWDKTDSTEECFANENSTIAENKDLSTLETGYMKELWKKGSVNPLIRPSQSTSTTAVLSKLRLSKIVQLKDLSSTENAVNPKYEIDFDVYTSKELRKQTKKNIALPQFRVVVCKYDEKPPSLFELSRLTQDSEGVHLKVGVVHQGTVTFYGIFSTDLPLVISVP